MKKLYDPPTGTIKNTSEKITKITLATSNKNNKAISDLNEKVLELMNDKGKIAPHLAPSLTNLFKAENESQFRLIKDLNSTKMKLYLAIC